MESQQAVGKHVIVQPTAETAKIAEVIREKKIKLREFCLFYLVFSAFSARSVVNCYENTNLFQLRSLGWAKRNPMIQIMYAQPAKLVTSKRKT